MSENFYGESVVFREVSVLNEMLPLIEKQERFTLIMEIKRFIRFHEIVPDIVIDSGVVIPIFGFVKRFNCYAQFNVCGNVFRYFKNLMGRVIDELV